MRRVEEVLSRSGLILFKCIYENFWNKCFEFHNVLKVGRKYLKIGQKMCKKLRANVWKIVLIKIYPKNIKFLVLKFNSNFFPPDYLISLEAIITLVIILVPTLVCLLFIKGINDVSQKPFNPNKSLIFTLNSSKTRHTCCHTSTCTLYQPFKSSCLHSSAFF